jgi:hypothetical protein
VAPLVNLGAHGGTYKAFLSEVASELGRFQPLGSFAHRSQTRVSDDSVEITVFTFPGQGKPSVAMITGKGLKAELEKRIPHQLYIIENINPTVLTLLGDHLHVDPQFYLDYLDAIMKTQYNHTKAHPTRITESIEPRPWFRLGYVEDHLPLLHSVKTQTNHVTFRFIGPRE